MHLVKTTASLVSGRRAPQPGIYSRHCAIARVQRPIAQHLSKPRVGDLPTAFAIFRPIVKPLRFTGSRRTRPRRRGCRALRASPTGTARLTSHILKHLRQSTRIHGPISHQLNQKATSWDRGTHYNEHRKNILLHNFTSHDTGWFIRIVTLAYYNYPLISIG